MSNVFGLNWGGVARQIREIKERNNGKLPAAYAQDLLLDTFQYTRGLPDKDQLLAIAKELRNTPYLKTFAELVQDKAARSGLFGMSVYTSFLRSPEFLNLYTMYQMVEKYGSEEVDDLIKELKNPATSLTRKQRLLEDTLRNHAANLDQLQDITVKCLKTPELKFTLDHVLSSLPEDHRNFHTAQQLFKTDTWIKGTKQTVQGRTGKLAQLIEELNRLGGIQYNPYQELFRNDAEFTRRYRTGLDFFELSKYDNPFKATVGLGQKTKRYLTDVLFRTAESPLTVLRRVFLPG